jgi:uncharacterized membrane protein
MSTLVVVAFDNPDTAGKALETLKHLQTEGALKVDDAAVVVRKADGEVSYEPSQPLAGAATGAAFGALWGTLLGAIFLMPIAGLALGAGAGALSGKLGQIGLEETARRQINDSLRPNTSQLFVRVSHVTDRDKVLAELEPLSGGTITQSNLSVDDQAALQQALA